MKPEYEIIRVLNQYNSKLDSFHADDFNAYDTDNLINRLIDEFGDEIKIYVETYDSNDNLINEDCIYDCDEGGIQE